MEAKQSARSFVGGGAMVGQSDIRLAIRIPAGLVRRSSPPASKKRAPSTKHSKSMPTTIHTPPSISTIPPNPCECNFSIVCFVFSCDDSMYFCPDFPGTTDITII